MPLPPADGHLWVTVADDENNTTWLFDATFLLTGYRCIYGQGCSSIDVEPDPSETLGCCVHGAHLVDDEDRQTVEDAAARLTDDQWQFRSRAMEKGGPIKRRKGGEWVTRKVAGSCIFLNRDGFEGGSGCALHIGAEAAGERPLDWKPDVCWQVPIRMEIHEDDYGHETVMIRAWARRDWGPGGADFHWWCIEDPVAYDHPDPLYLTSRDELIELVGDDIYDRLVEHLATLSPAGGERPAQLGNGLRATPVTVAGTGSRPDPIRT